MPRITKGMIAAARQNLEAIRDICHESGDASCYDRNAYSANHAIETLHATGNPLPDWIPRTGRPFLEAHGWRFP